MRTVSDIINSYDYLYDLSAYQVSELLDEIREEAIKVIKINREDKASDSNSDNWDAGYWIGFESSLMHLHNIKESDLQWVN